MRAILVSVDFADILAVTLPYNRHHFDDMLVVTTPEDKATKSLCETAGIKTYETDSFYTDGAEFNKWRALEEALDSYGRKGWLCLMDADVLWPHWVPDFEKRIGCLYTPKRRLLADAMQPIPPEEQWRELPLYVPNCPIFGGYSQVFHTDDPRLGSPPWHGLNWRHAGRGDTLFQSRWPRSLKIRPPFEVLHLGEPAVNWCGRVTQRLNGSQVAEADERSRNLQRIISTRQHRVEKMV